MKHRTKTEIEAQIEGLKKMKTTLPEYSSFGDANWEMINAQLEAIEILGCPLCGEVPELINRGNSHTRKKSSEIICHKCNLKIVVGAIHNSLEWTKDKVIEKWNKRTLTPQQDKKHLEGVVEALEGMKTKSDPFGGWKKYMNLVLDRKITEIKSLMK